MPAALLIPGLVFFGALVLLSLSQTLNVWGQSQTQAQQSFWGFIGSALTGKATVHAITKATRAAVSRWAVAQLKPVTRWFLALNGLILEAFRAQTEAIEATADAVDRLRHHTIPSAVDAKVAPVKATAHAASKTAKQAKASSSSTSTALHRYRVATAPKIAHATHAIDVAIPGQLGRIRTKESELSRDAEALRERTKALEHGAIKTFDWLRSHPFSAATGVFAGAISIALARLGYGFLRCNSWRNVGKRLTCSTGSFLLTLLEGAIEVLVVADLCQITTLMIRLANTGEVKAALNALTVGIDELLQCQGVERPAPLVARQVGLPPRQAYAELPAAG